jgi:hypothetical protein
METGRVSVTLCSLEYWPMDEVQNPVIPSFIQHYHTPSELIPVWAFPFISTVFSYFQEFS